MLKSQEILHGGLATLLEGAGYNVVMISYGLLLLKCFDIKMVKLPGCSSVGASLCSWPKKKKILHQDCENNYHIELFSF